MSNGKYHLSEEGKERLFKELSNLAQGKDDIDTPITVDFIHKIVKVNSLEEVIKNNNKLSVSYRSFLDLYGFSDMYDMYVYAMSCSATLLHKGRDFSKLVPVKRKVIRNGKETEVTVYENPNKDKDKDDKEKGTESSGRSHGHARELRATMHGGKKKMNTKEIAKLKQTSLTFPKPKQFKSTSDYFLTLESDDGATIGIVGYSVVGEYLRMDFYMSDGTVPGVAARGFAQLIHLALEEGKGVQAPHNTGASPVYLKFGLEQKDGVWSIDANTLKSNMGHNVKTNE